MLGLVLDADGKPGGEATKFFESLLGGMNKWNEEELQSLEEENKAYENESRYLKEELEELNKKSKQLEVSLKARKRKLYRIWVQMRKKRKTYRIPIQKKNLMFQPLEESRSPMSQSERVQYLKS